MGTRMKWKRYRRRKKRRRGMRMKRKRSRRGKRRRRNKGKSAVTIAKRRSCFPLYIISGRNKKNYNNITRFKKKKNIYISYSISPCSHFS